MPYSRTNSYSHRPSLLFILTLLVHLAVVTLHSVYIVPPITSTLITSLPMLPIMLGLFYLCLAILVYDYIRITTHDPVDRIVRNQALADLAPPEMLGFCHVCGHNIRGSYHCNTCGRCSEEFDHHCSYLNNCIAGQNYERFFRMLMIASLLHADVVGQGVWVFVAASISE